MYIRRECFDTSRYINRHITIFHHAGSNFGSRRLLFYLRDYGKMIGDVQKLKGYSIFLLK